MGQQNAKSTFHARMHAEGRWDLYKQFREVVRHLLIDKIPEKEIWKLTSFNFLPLDGSKHEVFLTHHLAKLLDGTGARELLQLNKYAVPEYVAWDIQPMDRPEPPPELAIFDDGPWLDGDPAAFEPEPAAVAQAVPTAPGLPPIIPPPIPTTDTGWEIYARSTVGNANNAQARLAQQDEIWAKIAYAMDNNKRCPILETAEWIYHHMGTPIELITAEDVPSPGALWHLRTLKENPSAAQEFLKTWMVKTIPDKRQMEFDGKKRLGSVKVFKNLDAFDEQFAAAEGVKEAA